MNKNDFFDALLNAFKSGEIGFNEPDLTKIFLSYLDSRFPSGVISKGILTQSRKRWQASKIKNGNCVELGDLLLILKRGSVYKYSFIQAKSVKNKDNKYSVNHSSFSGSFTQHFIMGGLSKGVYLMGNDWVTYLHNPKHKSITNYLVFYRTKDKTGDYFYDADLSAVQSNCKTSSKKSNELKDFVTSRRKIKSDRLTINNKKKATRAIADDLVFAKTLEDIFESISNFEIGDIMTPGVFKTLRKYINPRISRLIESNDMVWSDYDEIDNGEEMPVIIIDTTRNNRSL